MSSVNSSVPPTLARPQTVGPRWTILFGFGASLGLAAVALAAFVGAVILVESVDAEFEHPHGPRPTTTRRPEVAGGEEEGGVTKWLIIGGIAGVLVCAWALWCLATSTEYHDLRLPDDREVL